MGPAACFSLPAFRATSWGRSSPAAAPRIKTVQLSPLGVASSVGAITVIPAGFANAGKLMIASYNAGSYYLATPTADGSGTYNIGTATLGTTPGAGPEGFAYIAAGSPQFPAADHM